MTMVVMCVLFVAMVVVGFFAMVVMVRVGVCIMRMILMLILMCPMRVMVIMAFFAVIRMGITLLRCKAYAVTGFQKDRTRNIQKSDMRGRRGETVQ